MEIGVFIGRDGQALEGVKALLYLARGQASTVLGRKQEATGL